MEFGEFCEKLKDNLQKSENVLICLQKGNDLDTTASALSLAKLIELNFSNVKKIRFIQLTLRKSMLGDLKKYKFDENEKVTGENSLFITVDINVKDQIWDNSLALAKCCGMVMKIDHHDDSEPFGLHEKALNEISLVLTECCSCSEIIWKIAEKLDWKKNEEIASIVFHGLYSDSRWLVGEKVNSETFSLIGELSKRGVNTKDIMHELHGQDLKELFLLADLIKEAQKEGNMVIFNLNPEIVYRYYPLNFKKKKNNRIYQNKLLTFPLNILEFLLRANTILYIHYSIIAPFEGKCKYVFFVLKKKNEKIRQFLLDNGFDEHRNRYSRAIRFSELLSLLGKNKAILSE